MFGRLSLFGSLATVVLIGCGPSERDAPPPPSTSRRPVEQPAAPATAPAEDTSQASTSETQSSEAPATGDWGDLTGRFVYVGTPPEPKPVNVNKDEAVCTKHNPVDESLVVAEDGSLANVVVYVRDKNVKVHEDYEASAEEPAVLDNEHCRFEPHVLAIRTSQPLTVKNSDTVAHNTKVDTFVNAQINPLVPASSEQDFKFPQEENVPAPIGCNIHPWMRGYVLVRSNPYFAVSAKDGTFTIKNLPTGEHEFQFWHETAGYLGSVKLGKLETDRRGRAEIAIKPGANDLGDINVDQSKFKK